MDWAARIAASFIDNQPGHPGWLPVAPYNVGLVELAEGPGDAQLHPAGSASFEGRDALVLKPTDIGGRVLPAFRP